MFLSAVLAFFFFLMKRRPPRSTLDRSSAASDVYKRQAANQRSARTTRFLILIPAHNEEDGLPETLKSLSTIQYPKDLVHIAVIADRCADDTAKVARAGGAQCLERSEGPGGKGAAMSWAMQVLRNEGTLFDLSLIHISEPTRPY